MSTTVRWLVGFMGTDLGGVSTKQGPSVVVVVESCALCPIGASSLSKGTVVRFARLVDTQGFFRLRWMLRLSFHGDDFFSRYCALLFLESSAPNSRVWFTQRSIQEECPKHRGQKWLGHPAHHPRKVSSVVRQKWPGDQRTKHASYVINNRHKIAKYTRIPNISRSTSKPGTKKKGNIYLNAAARSPQGDVDRRAGPKIV